MKQLGRALAVALVICALPLLAGCSSQQDTTAQQAEPTAQSEPSAAVSPAASTDASAQSQDSSGDSVGGDVWEVITFPFRVVGDIVGFIL